MERGPELYAKIGDAKLRAVVTTFYDHMFRDLMIGFMFAGKDKAHLVEREIEFTAKFLGARDVAYTGRPMRTAHAQHTIFGGQFERRLQILREAMAAHDVDPDVQAVWIEHTQALRAQVTRDRGSECAAPGSPLPIARPEPDPDRPIRLGRKR